MLAVLALTALTALPPTGTYTVTLDTADLRHPLWEGLCGEKPTVDTLPQRAVVRVRHYNDGKSFWIDGGETWRIGSDLCPGTNRALKVIDATHQASSWKTRCESARVVKWTETSEHVAKLDGDTLTVKVNHNKSRRVRRSRCQVRIERTVILRREVDVATRNPGDVKVGAPVKRAAKPAPKVYDAASIEAELEKELLEETRLSKGTAKIIHQNRLDKEFFPVSASFVLDGTTIAGKEKKKVPLASSGTQVIVLDDVLTTGVHTLEVKLVYRVKSGGGVYRVELSDATFFDVSEAQPARLMINTVEKGSFLSEKTESGRIEFFMNGKKLDS